jgi:hypothetical protein
MGETIEEFGLGGRQEKEMLPYFHKSSPALKPTQLPIQ